MNRLLSETVSASSHPEAHFPVENRPLLVHNDAAVTLDTDILLSLNYFILLKFTV